MSFNPAFVGDDNSSVSGDLEAHEPKRAACQLTGFKRLPNVDLAAAWPTSQQAALLCPASGQSARLLQMENCTNSNKLNSLASTQCNSATKYSPAAVQPQQQQLYWSSSPDSSSLSLRSSLKTDFERNLTGQAAVECRQLRYHVGRGKKLKTILEDIDLTVPEGSIYGLLGPSGCGKTTMLRCLVGRIKPKSGSIKAFGYGPNEPGSRIPGSAIGYMPQEIAVQKYFTIYEVLTYYGKIHGMKRDLIDARIEFLLNFLDLPEKERIVENLSGGQKRRVSLAATLVHSPPLLVLDEPTVGVDPLLRQSIWKHLVFLAQTEKITVIITTHYIEEARQANVVGLMRHGRLLIEDSPEQLMVRFRMSNLEDVFLKLCVSDSSRKADQLARQGAGNRSFRRNKSKLMLDANGLPVSAALTAVANGGSAANAATKTTADGGGDSVSMSSSEQSSDSSSAPSDTLSPPERERFVINRQRLGSMAPGAKYQPNKFNLKGWFAGLRAIIWKNCIRIKRNPPLLLFEFLLPSVQLILFCLCIGGDPFDIPLAVVNDETIPFASRYFLDAIDKNTIKQIPYANLSSAIESVRRGETWGAIHIPDRYTQSLQDRLINPSETSAETLANSTINIYPDLTNLHLALAMESTFRKAFIKFAKDTLNMFGYDPEAAELPIRVEQPVYGTLKKDGFLEFMAPGVVISMTYVMAAGLTALVFILERRDGHLERSLVSGVTTAQVLLAHTAVQVVVMTMQISMVLTFKFLVFKIPSNGPFILVILLILLQGCTGMGFGLLISILCEEENTAVMMLVGTFYTNLMLAGIIWPLAAMPRWLRWFSLIQPQTLATEALRNVLSRGWGLAESGVYSGFLMTLAWLLVFLCSAALALRHSK